MKKALPTAMIAMIMSACAHQQHEPPPAKPAPMLSTAQDAYGVYRLCAMDDCPRPTPKIIAALPARAMELPQAPAPEKKPPRHVRVTIHFELAASRLTEQARAILNDASRDLLTAQRVVIRASTDAIGTKGFNRRLALARAKAVRDHLISMRVPPEIIHTETACCIENPPRINPPARRAEITIHIKTD